MRATEAGADAAVAQFDHTVLQALREVQTTLSRYAQDLDRLRLLEQAQQQAELASSQNRRLYQGGRTPYLSSLDAERTLATADMTLADAQAQVSGPDPVVPGPGRWLGTGHRRDRCAMNALLRDRQAWLFSAKTFAAAIAALYVGLAGNLSRPYWAMATVYIVSQPLLGPTRAKGVYRVLGTLLAGAATLVMLPNLVETPLLLSAAMALWLSACLFLALLNRGPRGYAFLLAGYTTAFIGFPAVTAPEGIFDTVVARSEEIILGTVMAVLFAALVFPASVRPMLTARIGNWMQDAAQWCRQVLQRGPAQAPRNRLAADLVQFEALIAFVRHDDPRHAGAAPALEHLRARMLLLLPVLSSIADRLDALHAASRALPGELIALLEDIGAWVERAGPMPHRPRLSSPK